MRTTTENLTLTTLLDFQAVNRAALARRLGVGKVTFSDWERGKRPCPEHLRARLADVLGVPADVVFDEKGVAR